MCSKTSATSVNADACASANIDIENTMDDNRGVAHLTTTDLFRNCDQATTEKFVIDLIKLIESGKIIPENKDTWSKAMRVLSRLHHINPGISQLNYAYNSMVGRKLIEPNTDFENLAVAKTVRSNSGVNVATVLTSPYPNGQDFSCDEHCSFCPEYEGMPKSYIPGEPAVNRGERNGWDAYKQVNDRVSALLLNGSPIGKLEILVLGGTWDSYPLDYQEEFVRDLYYAANTYFEDKSETPRHRLSLEEEITINQTARVKVIGLTLETRPDQINSENIRRYRRYGCTRIQLGIQHTNDDILRKNNRGCYTDDTIRAIWNLLNNGFKVDGHLMPDLPGATPELDREMFDQVNTSPHFRVDQLKIYPCETTPYTKIKEWMDAGKYEHYDQTELMNLIMEFKDKVPEWVRLNRVVRDIPTHEIIDGIAMPNLRQVLHKKMAEKGLKCKCIRCREVKSQKEALDMAKDAELVVRQYDASDGVEYFISFESPCRSYIYGFCRLRLSPDAGYCRDIPRPRYRKKTDVEQKVVAVHSLKNTAMIRELHVYGKITPVGATKKTGSQHYGFGKRMMAEAERIATEAGYTRISVISGIGVREFYQKLGYYEQSTYMMKDLVSSVKGFLENSYNALRDSLRKT